MKAFLVRGVPQSLQHDAWWMSAEAGPSADGPAKRRLHRGGIETQTLPWRILILIALMLLADVLFWGRNVGLSLAVWAGAIGLAAVAMRGWKIKLRAALTGAGILLLTVAPVIEQVQFLSLLFYGAGLAVFAGWIGLESQGNLKDIVTAAVRFLVHGPGQVERDARKGAYALVQGRFVPGKSTLLDWGLPVGLGLVFVALLMAANPFVERWLDAVIEIGAQAHVDLGRITFWAIAAVLVWPFLILSRMHQRLRLGVEFGKIDIARPRFLNALSVRNSLILFNVMFLVQSGLDGVYLWGHAALPDGMTYASYAHRGAYPLIATALLAGAFALVAGPFAKSDRMMGRLLYLWLGQNVLLVVSSLYRLDLYVGIYGLTYLRVAAFIWMGLVAFGLGLIAYQMARSKTGVWLLGANFTALIATLFASCFINFAGVIADYNLTHTTTRTEVLGVDRTYLCGLGRMAQPAIVRFELRTGIDFCYLPQTADMNKDWREWGFRDWRVTRYLAAQQM